MKTKTVQVTEIRDPYFGRTISRKGDEIAKVLAFYAKDGHWTTFSYRHWSGYEEDVQVRINLILLDERGDCYVEMESNADILDHYWPSVCDLIDRRYLCGTSSSFIPESFTKVIYDA